MPGAQWDAVAAAAPLTWIVLQQPDVDPDPDKQEKSIFPEGSVIIDPWRKCPQINGCTVVHYGNTRLGKK